MSLNLAYEIARGSLAANSISSSVVSRNIANVDNPNAARKTANLVSIATGGVNVDSITNAVDAALFESVVAVVQGSVNLLQSHRRSLGWMLL